MIFVVILRGFIGDFHGMNHDFQWKHEDLWKNNPWTLGISGDSTWILLKDYSFTMWQHQSWPWIKEGTGAKSEIPCPNVEDHQQHAHWVNMHPTDRMPFQIRNFTRNWMPDFKWVCLGNLQATHVLDVFFVKLLCFLSMFPSTNSGRETMGLIWRSRTGKNTQWSSPTHSKNIDLSKGI